MHNSSRQQSAMNVPVHRSAGLRRWFLPLTIAVVAMTCSVLPSGSSLLLHAAGMAAQETDTDGDTMPDAWEDFFGLDPDNAADAAADPDNDGRTNAQEFAARRHPLGHHVRYFAEGSTGFFDTSVAVLNLSATDPAHVALALLSESGGVISHRFTLGPRQRQSVPLNSVLASGAVAIIVESDVAVAADRFMTWGTSGIGASLDSGASAPATTWYVAEGATGPFFLYYLLQNPATTPATVTVRYLVEGATPISRTRTLPPQSRTTIFVNEDDPALARASLGGIVTSDVPIFVERAMYIDGGGTFGGGAASAASPQLSTQWYFGEGATGPFFQAFLAMLNPGTVDATATVTYHLGDGSTVAKAYTVPAEGRRTVWFNGEAESDPALAALASGPVWFTVSSTEPILGERAMWWATWPWYEGHASPGSTTTGMSWAVPEGRTGGPAFEQTYVLIGNTTSTAGAVRVTLIPDTGAASTRDLPIPAGERLTVNVGALFGLTDARFSVIVDSLGANAAPLAVDYARYRSVNGIAFSGGGAAPAVLVAGPDAAPVVSSTTPAATATGVTVDANLSVTFSEPVDAGAGAFVLECPASTPIALTNLTASPATTFTLDPATNLPLSTACTLRVVAGQVTDVDAMDPPDAMAADAVVPFTTSATGPNQAPSFTAGANQTALEDGGSQAVAGWATAISPGPANEAGQTVTFAVTGNTNPGLFSVAPQVSAAGTLTYTPAANATGASTITLVLQDDGGTAGGGVDTSTSHNFTITLTTVNDAPGFTAGTNPSSAQNAGPQTVTPWATGISAGPAHEAGQTLLFAVTDNTNPLLFSALPAVSSAGVLTYTSAPNAFGSAQVTLVLQDNGGTANGGVSTSAPQTFTITVTPTNAAPTLTNATIAYSTVGNTQLHVQGATLPGLAAVSDANGILVKSGPIDTDGPAAPAAVALTSVDTGEGTITLAADGSFTYVPDAGFSGIDTFTVQVTDSIAAANVTVNITVGRRVWYVNNETGPNNPAGGDGRSNDAYETLAEAQAASGPDSTIFVFNGLTATAPLTGGIALQNGQKLIGEGIGLSVAGFPALVPAGTQPRIVASADAVTVVANVANLDRTGVEIRGLNLASTTGNAVAASSADTQNLGVRISENTITSAALDGIIVVAASTGTATVAVHDNVITATGAAIRVEGGRTVDGIDVDASATFNVSNNTMRDSVGTALVVRKRGGNGTWSGTIANNTVGVAGVPGSGSAGGSGIFVLAGGSGPFTATITGNQVRQYSEHGIFAQADGAGVVGNASMNLTVTGNTVTEPVAGGGPASNGFHLSGGTTPGDTSQVCVALSGNALAGSGQSGTDFRVRQRQSATVRLPGYAGSTTDTAAVVAFIQGLNPGAETGEATVQVPPGGGFVGAAACTTP